MRRRGFEPPSPCGRYHLKVVRLPISPPARVSNTQHHTTVLNKKKVEAAAFRRKPPPARANSTPLGTLMKLRLAEGAGALVWGETPHSPPKEGEAFQRKRVLEFQCFAMTRVGGLGTAEIDLVPDHHAHTTVGLVEVHLLDSADENAAVEIQCVILVFVPISRQQVRLLHSVLSLSLWDRNRSKPRDTILFDPVPSRMGEIKNYVVAVSVSTFSSDEGVSCTISSGVISSGAPSSLILTKCIFRIWRLISRVALSRMW